MNAADTQSLLRFVSDELLGGTMEIAADDDLLADGMVDSLGMVRLVGFVEQRFEIAVPPVDFTIENFRSIATLTAYVSKRVHGGSRAD